MVKMIDCASTRPWSNSKILSGDRQLVRTTRGLPLPFRRWFRLVQIFEVGAVAKGSGRRLVLDLTSYCYGICTFARANPGDPFEPTDAIQWLGNHPLIAAAAHTLGGLREMPWNAFNGITLCPARLDRHDGTAAASRANPSGYLDDRCPEPARRRSGRWRTACSGVGWQSDAKPSSARSCPLREDARYPPLSWGSMPAASRPEVTSA